MSGKKVLLTALFVVAFVLLTITARAQQTGVILANSQREIVLDKAAWLGNTLLPAGTYTVHSHGKDAKQQVHFAQDRTITEVAPEYSSVTVYDEVAKVDCNTVALSKAPERTALHLVDDNGVMRIVSVDIKGETHAHVF